MKTHKLFNTIAIVILLLISLFFRFYKISEVPISLNWDETAFGYNAYSILTTGKDEYGIKYPLSFKSVGDYKCPLFVYLMVPVIKFLGLNEFSVRFLSSFFGALTVLFFYFLIKEIFEDQKIAFLSGLILAISPWHLQFTRAQGDVAISSFFVVLGIWFFLIWIKRKSKISIMFSSICFSLTFYAYFSERIFVPVLVLLLTVLFRKEIFPRKKEFLTAGILALIILFPLMKTMLSSGQKSKIVMTTIFGYERSDEYLKSIEERDYYPFIINLFHNKTIEYSLMVADRYLNQFSPFFLFIRGAPDDRQKIFGMGMLYLSDLFLLIFAAKPLINEGKYRKMLRFVLLWLAIAPIPAIITRDPVHARRAFNMIYPICILLGIGANNFFEWLKEKNTRLILKTLVSFGFLLLFLWSLSLYLLSYYIYTPLQTYAGPGGWNYGYKQLVSYISPLKEKYNKIVIDTSYQGPYLFFLFYEKYSPAKYQPQALLIQKDESLLGEGRGFDNYEFRDIYWPDDRGIGKTLFAGSPERLPRADIDPKQSRLIKQIYFPDGKVAFNIIETF